MSWWMIPAWPFLAVAYWWNFLVAPHIRGPYIVADSFRYEGAENQVSR